MINNWENFIKSLSESLDTSNIKIEWTDSNDRYYGIFDIEDRSYRLDFKKIGDVYGYKFYSINKLNGKHFLSPDKTNLMKDGYKVLSMAKQGLIHFIETKSPNGIVFSAIDEDSKKVKVGSDFLTKRQHIYLMLLEQIPTMFPEYGYTIDTVLNNQIYQVFKNKLDNKEYTFKNIQLIVTDFINSLE